MTGHLKIFLKMLVCILAASGIFSVRAQRSAVEKIDYTLIVHYKDSVSRPDRPVIRRNFPDLKQLSEYLNALPQTLAARGYAVSSVDSVWQEKNTFHVLLFLGTKYNWIQLRTNGIDKDLLARSGYNAKNFSGQPMNIAELDVVKEKLLKAYENEGFPFAGIFLDSVTISDNNISAVLTADKGIVYRVDSIRNYGKLKLNPRFLQQYLNIRNGSIYNRDKLKDVDRRMLELPYAQTVQQSTLNMLGSGSILNLYVDNRKSSEASAIFGLLPSANNTGKFQLTGDVNLDLKNVFGAGEGLIFKYQALQPKSPRLNLGYDKPYILRSPFGFGFLFELFKKDSSYLQVNAQVSLQLDLSAFQTGRVVLQWQTTNLLEGGIDTSLVAASKKLPDVIDVKSVNAGFIYNYAKTNYRFNPVRGNEVGISAIAGIKNIQKNNDIISLKSGGFNYAALYDTIRLRSYQFRVTASGAKYLPVGKRNTLKTALNLGIYSSPNIFRNEVFQIGGYRLLRGFDEESIYATQYAVTTVEYRYIVNLNSYLFAFTDLGAVKADYAGINAQNFFTGVGAGIVYETKAGLLNLSLAVGKRNDTAFNLRDAAKIHFGYVNYF